MAKDFSHEPDPCPTAEEAFIDKYRGKVSIELRVPFLSDGMDLIAALEQYINTERADEDTDYLNTDEAGAALLTLLKQSQIASVTAKRVQ